MTLPLPRFREVARATGRSWAKAAGAMQAALVGAAQLFAALPAKAARGFGALQEKQDA